MKAAVLGVVGLSSFVAIRGGETEGSVGGRSDNGLKVPRSFDSLVAQSHGMTSRSIVNNKRYSSTAAA